VTASCKANAPEISVMPKVNMRFNIISLPGLEREKYHLTRAVGSGAARTWFDDSTLHPVSASKPAVAPHARRVANAIDRAYSARAGTVMVADAAEASPLR
jgi:hypothetical protein